MLPRRRQRGRREPLALIGVGCRFPGAHGPEELWRVLLDGREQVGPRPAYRARTRAGEDLGLQRRGGERRGSLGDVENFDWRAFQMSPRESKYVDPQQRLLLETAWEAFEDAGLPFERVRGTRTSVYVGIMWPDYAKLLAENPEQLAGYATPGVGFALAANRVSHCFDLRGPSVALDVQCASSLVAVSLAAASIWAGEAEMALAGGVNLILAADSDVMMSRAGILSASGHCSTFDIGADGFVRSEGVGLVLLKPLARARADGDRVLATLRGTACNHDGRRAALTAPAHESQVELLNAACAAAGVSPADLDYVELHGTGTQKGDPIEAAALAEAVGEARVADPCLVGSVKSNLGHCESAAGVASLIKVALALHRGVIPATINHSRLNPAIERARSVRLVTATRRWPQRRRPWLAGVSGLSLGGGNAHVVLEGPPAARRLPRRRTKLPRGELVLPLAAATDESLRALAGAYAAWVEGLERAELAALCAAAALRRTHHPRHRAAVRGERWEDFAAPLREVAAGGSGVPTALPRSQGPPPVVLIDPDASPAERLARLYEAGRDVVWAELYGEFTPPLDLPSYPFRGERLWIDPAEPNVAGGHGGSENPPRKRTDHREAPAAAPHAVGGAG